MQSSGSATDGYKGQIGEDMQSSGSATDGYNVGCP
jgi:hypothetical protein